MHAKTNKNLGLVLKSAHIWNINDEAHLCQSKPTHIQSLAKQKAFQFHTDLIVMHC